MQNKFEVLGFNDAYSETQKTTTHEVKAVPFGINCLDRMTGGILKNDVIILSAPTGAGKTELAYTMIASAAKAGYKVAALCLEAEYQEFENRTLFRALAKMYKYKHPEKRINYLDWRLGRLPELDACKDEVMPSLSYLKNIKTFYRKGSFDIMDLTRTLSALEGEIQLCLLDHIDFVDSDDRNENQQKTEIMMRIRDLGLLQGLPILCVSHMKKLSRSEQILVGDMSDIMGSSNITKIATKVITLGSDGIDDVTGYPRTVIRLAKFRMSGDRTHVLARLIFNTSTNTYEDHFEFGYLSTDQKRFEPIYDRAKLPIWLQT